MTNRIQAIFQDARDLQADALEMLAQVRMCKARLMRRYYTHQVHTGDGFGIARDGQTAKPQTFRTGDGWFASNLSANLAQVQG